MFTVEALHLTIVDYSRFLMLVPKVKSAQMKKIPSSYGFHNNFIFSFNLHEGYKTFDQILVPNNIMRGKKFHTN